MDTQRLIEELKQLNGTFATIVYQTTANLIKNDVFAKGSVTKITTAKNVQIGYNYENAVNNHLAEQGSERNFVAQKLPYGKWYIENKVIEHNGNYQLRYYIVANTKCESEYFVNGIAATPTQLADIKRLLRSKAPSGTQSAVGLDERQVKPQNVKFENILSIKINGVEL